MSLEQPIADEKRKITQKEYRTHTEEGDLWLLIEGKVYDVTKFKHPGGKRILLNEAGKDATKSFINQGHS
jgi:cytochrome b involved in lipid metabolism